mmetsp:Transcript_6810/g.9948  ORF Transcript_6810/g.9948 Transcript_6810/m.9948 type:complete len:305 (-) Transcript_6810:46-960(-)|eukprot:CAMPEP_0194026854 /NCGR_PEP_ID=MMETSP0009_2-20130614/1108_1 /TAXON_ID=210454 /ORGANISM="Grammatophora oceanica, Strain CCMP 410" /LENGTH=304 /DNA_ID=CAMNT_0038665725 /DNA_START=9 /DNA_END=923 /DNA_ORIENTATION=-
MNATAPFETDDGASELSHDGAVAHIIFLAVALIAAVALTLIVCCVPECISEDFDSESAEEQAGNDDDVRRRRDNCCSRWYYRCLPCLIFLIVGFSMLSAYSRLAAINEDLEFFGPMTVRNITLETEHQSRKWFTLARIELEWRPDDGARTRTTTSENMDGDCKGILTVCEDPACKTPNNAAVTEECSDTEYIESLARVEQCLVDSGFRNEDDESAVVISAYGSCEDRLAVLTIRSSKMGVRVGGYIALVGVLLLLVELAIFLGWMFTKKRRQKLEEEVIKREDESLFLDPSSDLSLKKIAPGNC